MKVLFFYFKYPLYSHGCYFQEFLDSLAGSVDEIYLVATHYPEGDFDKPNNIKIFWLPLLQIDFVGEIVFMFSALLKVMLTKELRSVDVVNSSGPRGLLAGWYLKKVHKIPLVLTVEMLNERTSLLNAIYYSVVCWLLARAPIDKIVYWSKYFWETQLSPWGIPEDRGVHIPAGINLERYSPNIDGSEVKSRYAPDSPLIVFAKPLYSTNTQAAKLLVRAMAILKKSQANVKLLLGGGDDLEEVQKFVKELDMGDRVSFMPPTPFPEIPKYIAAADLVVLPYTYSATTSRSLLEAMAMGKPIVATPAGEVVSILEDGKSGVFIGLDPKDIAAKIKRVLGDKELMDRLGENARRTAVERFAMPQVVEQRLAVYKDLQ